MEFECSICRKDEMTPGVKMMVSKCSHQICEDCLREKFRITTTSVCTVCNEEIKRKDFFFKYFEEIEVEKEIAFRKEVFSTLYKTQEDFSSLQLYNDYLEQLENYVYDLTNERNQEEIRKVLSTQNRDELIKNKQNRLEYLESLKNRAIIEDSVYNEDLKENALRLQEESESELEVEMNEMPPCMNIESVLFIQNYSLTDFEADFKALFLSASGCDPDEHLQQARKEFLEGFL